MAILELPTRTDVSVYDYTIELDSVVFRLSWTYNTRAGRWYLSCLDLDGNRLRDGLKVVSNWVLTQAWVQQGRPVGKFVCANPQTDDDPTRESIGTSSVMTYGIRRFAGDTSPRRNSIAMIFSAMRLMGSCTAPNT